MYVQSKKQHHLASLGITCPPEARSFWGTALSGLSGGITALNSGGRAPLLWSGGLSCGHPLEADGEGRVETRLLCSVKLL